MLALVARYITKLALAFWIGEMLFFVIIFAPRVFRVLLQAAELQAAIFPPYYMSGLICGVLILLGMIVNRPERPWAWGLAVFATLVFAYSRFSITPELLQLQPQVVGIENPDPAAAERFKEIHRLSVQVNGAALMGLLVLLALL